MARHSFRFGLAFWFPVGIVSLCYCGITAATPRTGSSVPPPDSASSVEPLHVQIDRLVSAKTPNFGSLQAPLASDAEFLRRVSLDLAGTIPSSAAAREFLADKRPDKRARLVDSLLASPEHARHFAELFDAILMRRINTDHVSPQEWREYLRQSFAENKPYDQLVREILSADGGDPKTHCRSRFYVDRQGEMNEITRDVGRLFLGADLECAQCHDHPQIEDFRQEHYYSLAAFFIRSSLYRTKNQQFMMAEKANGEASFESVLEIRDKISTGPKTAKPRLFDGPALVEPVFAKVDEAYVTKPGKDVRPVPKYSRLSSVARAITAPENTRFSRTAANRLWSLLMGRGVIEPVDLDHSFNPPSHPDLLDALTRHFARHKCDVRDFVREVVLSRTYQTSSRRVMPDGSPAANAPAESFAQATLRPLSPEQLARSLLQATGNIESPPAVAPATAKGKKSRTAKNRGDFTSGLVTLFAGVPGKPSTKFEASPVQALYLSNNPRIVELTAPRAGNLAERLQKITDAAGLAEELYLSMLTRFPEPADLKDVTDYLANVGPSDRPKVVRELIWALATSAEFRFNH